MKVKMISYVTMLSIAFALAIFLGSCSNSSNEETKGSDQETALKDSSENAVADLQQPTSESAIDQESSQDVAPEKESVYNQYFGWLDAIFVNLDKNSASFQ